MCYSDHSKTFPNYCQELGDKTLIKSVKLSFRGFGLIPVLAIVAFMITSPVHSETLVLSAPNKSESYYAPKYKSILKFQADYAKAISKRDKVVILTDDAGYKYFSQHLPESMLLRKPVEDIWARDFSPVAHKSGVQFRLTSYAGGGRANADAIQGSFNRAIGSAGVRPKRTDYILDGGNYVGMGNKAIVTERFLEDNRLSMEKGKTVLKQLLGVSQVAIIPADDPGLAHADGMVMFGDTNTLFVNEYRGNLRKKVMAELTAAFPKVKIVELPVGPLGSSFDPRYTSACGIYVNSVVTSRAIYIPQFGSSLDKKVLDIVRQNTRKAVVPIAAKGVCSMGGSARCLVWQAMGSHGSKMLAAARKN